MVPNILTMHLACFSEVIPVRLGKLSIMEYDLIVDIMRLSWQVWKEMRLRLRFLARIDHLASRVPRTVLAKHDLVLVMFIHGTRKTSSQRLCYSHFKT